MARSRSGAAVAAALVLLGLAAGVAGLLRRRPVPGLLLVTIDTLRADRVGCYGCAAARTPALDGLAAEGAMFEDCTASAPMTLPSHATILTGLHPPRHGLRDNSTPFPLPPAQGRSFRTAAEILRQGGWQTAAFLSGSPLSPRWGLDAGFDTYDAAPEAEPGNLNLGERAGGATADEALGWLGRRDRDRPWFLWLHLFDPHAPYAAPGGAGHPPDSVEAYDEEVTYADRQLGRVLDSLRAEGTLDGTVVAVCSDHGEGLGEHGETTHGYFLYRSTLRVPLLLRFPARVPAGARVAAPVSLADLLPTLLDLVGKPESRPLDGRSLLPALAAPAGGAPAPPPSDQYAETLYGWRTFLWAESVAVRDGNRRVLDHGGSRREIYDLATDPGETRDLASAPVPGDAAAAERAWALFGSPSLQSSPATGPQVEALQSIPYVAPAAPSRVFSPERNGLLPLPSASLLRRFEEALRMLQRAAAEEDLDTALDRIQMARKSLEALDREQPANPATAYWIGRSWRQEAKLGEDRKMDPWRQAGLRFQEAGRRGYRDSRTVSLMLEAAFQVGEYGEMLALARTAVETAHADGDASFWTWVALAWIEGGEKDPYGKPTASSRAAFDEAIQRAVRKSRGPAEEKRIREVRAKYQ